MARSFALPSARLGREELEADYRPFTYGLSAANTARFTGASSPASRAHARHRAAQPRRLERAAGLEVVRAARRVMSACRPSAKRQALLDEVVGERHAARAAERARSRASPARRASACRDRRAPRPAARAPPRSRSTARPGTRTSPSWRARCPRGARPGCRPGGRRRGTLRPAGAANVCSGPNCSRAIWPVCSITPGALDARGDVRRAAHHRRFRQRLRAGARSTRRRSGTG